MPASALLSYTSLLHSHPTLLCKCRVARGEIDRDAWEFICHTCVNLLCSIQKCCLIHFFAGNQCSKEEKGPTDNRTNIWMRVIAKNSLALKTHKSYICAPSKHCSSWKYRLRSSGSNEGHIWVGRLVARLGTIPQLTELGKKAWEENNITPSTSLSTASCPSSCPPTKTTTREKNRPNQEF